MSQIPRHSRNSSQLGAPVCVLPNCQTPVTRVGEPCGDCRQAWGSMLGHNPAGVPLTEEQIAERDSNIRARIYAQRMIREGR